MASMVVPGWKGSMGKTMQQANLSPAPAPVAAPGGSSSMGSSVGMSASLRPAFDINKQRSMLDRVFGMQSDQLRTGAADQAKNLALRSGMSVNGGQTVTTQNEILAPQMQALQLARMQAELGLERDQAEFQMQMERDAESRRRWQAEHDMAKQQYEDEKNRLEEAYSRSPGGRAVQALSSGGGGAPAPRRGGRDDGGYGTNVIGGSPGFSPEEMPDKGQLLSNIREPKTPDRAIPADRPSSIRPGDNKYLQAYERGTARLPVTGQPSGTGMGRTNTQMGSTMLPGFRRQ